MVSLLPCCMLVVFLMPAPLAVPCLLSRLLSSPSVPLPVACVYVVGAHVDVSRTTAPLP